MKLEEAIKTAIEFETRVHNVYVEASAKSTDDKAKKVFDVLAMEEQGHLDYLQSRLDEWQKTGSITEVELTTVIPSKEAITEGVAKLEGKIELDRRDFDIELEMLQQALAVEVETCAFYQRMASELSEEGQKLFTRFLVIEDGHQTIVQAALDNVSGLGFWFGTCEFDLEAG